MTQARRMRLVCTAMAALFLCVAAGRIVVAVSTLADPAFSTTHVYCVPIRCWAEADPVRLLAPEEREIASAPVRRAALLGLLEERKARLILFTAEAVRGSASALLFLCLALALRGFARGGLDSGAIVWLRRAAAAALATVLVQPVADTLRATALSPVTTGKSQLYIAFNGGPFFWGLLLAGGVWVCVRALEQARRAETELAQIV